MGEKKTVYWHLPGLCSFRLLNQMVINLMRDYPDKFREGYQIGSVYGTIPGAVWNGGRAVFGILDRERIAGILKGYNDREIPVRFTWTNTLLEKRHLYDTYCNLIMELGNNGINQALVNSPELEQYIRREFPAYTLVSSTTKRMTDREALKRELEKDYKLVVLDYDLNRDEKALAMAQSCADKVEILVDEICYPNCPKRSEHYRDESRMQLAYTMKTDFKCTNKSTKPAFTECRKRPAFISNEEIQGYIDRGFVNFKLVGRGLPLTFVRDSYLYFLVKDEAQAFVQEKIDTFIKDVAKKTKK